MPGPITHYLLGEKTINLLSDNAIQTAIREHRQVFNLGTQGPDIFFYYRVWPWTKNDGKEIIGDRLHEENIQAFFAQVIDYALNRKETERNLLFSYLAGYLCHYALDIYTHPYIFYRTGFLRPGELPTSKYIYQHRIFETNMDFLMLKMLMSMKPFDLKINKLISVQHKEAESIGKMYEEALPRIFSEKISSRQVYQAIKDMVRVQTVLRDRWGLKKKIICWIEKKLGHYPLISSVIYPTDIKDCLDYLNEQHKFWFLPWDRSGKETLSFPELFDLATQEAKELCMVLFRCLNGQLDIDFVLDRIGNRSFSTGIDCSSDIEFRYFEDIFDSSIN